MTYLLLCYKVEGFAYKSGFYLSIEMPKAQLAATLLIYVCIAIIIVLLTMLIPNKKYFFTIYGARTLSVYVLHMLIVFPLSWEVFSRLPNNTFYFFLNIVGVPLLSVFLFSNRINELANKLLDAKWGYVIVVYLFSLFLVNSNMILKFLQ